ncbi:MAG: hypothetical protein VYE27_03560 [Pseudomonadota bacterium]|nr:hypothetical protein [Pseudomonadota bacterium]
MQKYNGFPSRMSGTDYQFKIRRANPKGATKLVRRDRYRDRRQSDLAADREFLRNIIEYFGEKKFQRGCLDAGRLSWLLGREIVPASDPFDPNCYEAMLRVDLNEAKLSFPEIFVL